MFDLTGKTALVTGATGGIGKDIARSLHAAGATVALSGTRLEALEALAAEIGPGVHVLPCNLSDRADADRLIPAAEEALNGLDILVNNAGVTRDMLTIALKDKNWDEVIEVNLTTAFRLSRAALRGMIKKRFGRIIGITSIVGVTGGVGGQANYAASKAGMIGMSKSLAAEVAARGVTVNCVAPGFIESPMTDKLTDDLRKEFLKRIPAGRFGVGADVAGAVVYLASAEAAYVTGQTLHVNGGMAMI
jgi:3-oxoacyl-[acyl-carrier protein] reductase